MQITAKILITSGIFFIGCQSVIAPETPPEWAQDILSRSTNLNLLVGNWEYSSVMSFDNSECSGEGQSYDYSGSIVYGDTEVNQSYNALYSYSDFQSENYSVDNFKSDCGSKGGTITSEGNCGIIEEETLEYYLVDSGGYCEVYIKESKSVTYCGSILFDGNTASISFTWNSDNSKWESSGCKVINLSAN